ncbi:hypothetical protein RHMOL_Rhmol01G0219600 [Rhododendron molle]|uniref:Uncharacterized protein n=1 Tax=Rhododendron molle TaxID=49168 RepID=A0ACC0Q5H2_RHOML|nr:hypothetical protein RHMOL_Rhmol01G0219600 [Rhododendron molle]
MDKLMIIFDINSQSNPYVFTHVKANVALTPPTRMQILTSQSLYANFQILTVGKFETHRLSFSLCKNLPFEF